MNPSEQIRGYDYGSDKLPASPITLSDLESMQRLTGLSAADRALLFKALPIMEECADEILDAWRDALQLDPAVAVANRTLKGEPYAAYTSGYRPRFRQWFFDVCTRSHDQAWLNYQHEIGIRHHRVKKNVTDGVQSSPHIPLRFLLSFVAIAVNTVKPYFEKYLPARQAALTHAAWVKVVVLSVTLWSVPYTNEGDW